MTKAITWVVVAIVVIAGAWYLFGRAASTSPASGTASTYQPSQGQTETTATSGTSNSDLDQGLSSIDAQMNAAANASASANDTTDNPVTQTE